MTQARRILLKSSPTDETTPGDGVLLGKALAMDHRRVLVARDLMKSSPMMAEAVISGLLFQGADVIDAGVLSAPATAVAASDYDCAVYVVGREGMTSGYILLNPDGRMYTDRQIRHLELVFQTPPQPPEHDGLGRYTRIDGLADGYDRHILENLRTGFKNFIILDCRCGTTTGSILNLLSKVGVDAFAFNTHDDPNYEPYARNGDEGTDNLEDIVRISPGSIGIRLNGTGTAMEVVDERGELLSMDTVFSLLIMYLKPNSIAIPIDAPSVIEDAFLGRIPIEIETPFSDDNRRYDLTLTEDNASAICDAVAEGVELGYYHGSILFNNGAKIGDGIHAAVLMAEMSGDNSLHQMARALPEYFRESEVYPCEIKADMFRHACEDNLGQYQGRYSRYGNAFRISMDSGWFIIRYTSSGGDNQIEVIAESQDRAYLLGMMEIADEIVDLILVKEQ